MAPDERRGGSDAAALSLPEGSHLYGQRQHRRCRELHLPRAARPRHRELGLLSQGARRGRRLDRTTHAEVTMIRANFIGMAAVLALAPGIPGAHADDQACEQDDDGILSIDHYVNHVSTVRATAGEHVQLFVRERVRGRVEDLGRRTEANGKAVLFVHGGTYPSVPDYDLRFKDYDWMSYLAGSGFDVYSMDIQGYDWATRSFPLGDPGHARLEHTV